jgi:competence protein ComEC
VNNSDVFYTIFSGFILGIVICSFVELNFAWAIYLLVLSFLIFVFAKFGAKNKNKIILVSIFIFSLSLGILRFDLKEIRDKNEDIFLSKLVGQKVTMTGLVSDEPNVKEDSVRLTVDLESIGETKFNNSKVSVKTRLFPQFKYGDLISISGKIEKPQNFVSTSSPDFDYVGFLAKDDIFYEISFANAKLISDGHGSYLKTQLFNFKKIFMDKINLLIKEPESSLLGGLLLGAKNSLGKVWQDNFRQAGVSHIVALSGYNITIVAEGIMLALSFLPRIASLSCGALGIFFFAIMTGGSATVLRASIMALLVLLAKATGRTYDVIRALFLAGLFMIIQNPKILVFDISFELSFLSTMALIFVSPLIENKFLFITEKYQLRSLILSTIATQIFVLPFIFYKMGMISIVSLPANVLILPIIPTIMLFGFLTGVISLFSSILATPFALISSLLLSYILKVIEFFANLPFSSIQTNNFSLSLVVLIYLIFAAIIWRSQIKTPPLTNLNL